MRNVLLVTLGGTDAPKAVGYAIARAKEAGGGLIAVAVLDPEFTQRVAATLAEVGFVGEKLSDTVTDTLAREQRQQAESLLSRIGEQAKQAGVEFTPLIEEGDVSEVCARIAGARGVGFVVLVAEKPSWLTRLLSRAITVKLPALAGCDVKVMDE